MLSVDRQKGTPAASAARAACTSPRRANMPEKPTGPQITGIDSDWPNRVVAVLSEETSFITRWRRAIDLRSSTFRLRVISS